MASNDEENPPNEDGTANSTTSDARSSSTSASKVSLRTVISRKRAEAAAKKVALRFAKDEAELRRKQIENEAELRRKQFENEAEIRRKQTENENEIATLQHEREVQVCEAEINVLEEELSESQSQYGSVTDGQSNHNNVNNIPKQSAQDRTREYVNDLSKKDKPIVDNNEHSSRESVNDLSKKENPIIDNNEHSCTNTSFDMSKLLLKKELLMNRLRTFSDKPESYPVWKETFRQVCKSFELEPAEEFDLLIKWLGPNSRPFAETLRAANMKDPKEGLVIVWQRLDQRYGSPLLLEMSLTKKLSDFPKIGRDSSKLYELSDLLTEINCLKTAYPDYRAVLAHFDSATGVNSIVNKLPIYLQERWNNKAFDYKEKHHVTYPPFSEFVSFVNVASRQRNDPSLQYTPRETTPSHQHVPRGRNVTAAKTDIVPDNGCPLHNNAKHALSKCNIYLGSCSEDRWGIVKKHYLCFRCLQAHHSKDCQSTTKCDKCGNGKHDSTLHIDGYVPQRSQSSLPQMSSNRGQNRHPPISSNCTQVCNGEFQGRSCARHVPVYVYPKDERHKAIQMYATIDDQSNASLCSSTFFETFNVNTDSVPYTLTSCSGQKQTSGRRASGFIIESCDGQYSCDLPTLIECNDIPDRIEEIATPEVAYNHPHLRHLTYEIPPLAASPAIQLLIGRDLPDVHHVMNQVTGPPGSPYAQKLPLGWVIIGKVCLGQVHPPDDVYVKKTHILPNGRPTLCIPCPNQLHLKVKESDNDNVNDDIFRVTPEDDLPGHSREDQQFIGLMDKEMKLYDNGKWEAPLPFKPDAVDLPDNRQQVLQRARSLTNSLRKNPKKQSQFIEYMDKLLENHHAELAPPMQENDNAWYIPIFAVYHPKKPDKIRVVFDSSCKCDDVSLNSVLMSGPDLMNSLLGVLLRFRKDSVAIMADIEQMFHCFEVCERDQNYLRFFWHKDNDPTQELTEYRMRVHVFGNVSSPAVATYGLRRAAHGGENKYGSDTRDFVEKDFYVDDGITSRPSDKEAISLLQRTQDSLFNNGRLRLHKIVSNSVVVMKSFNNDDLGKDIKDLDFIKDIIPLQRSLGIIWDVNKDIFTFRVSQCEKPFTKRNVLSVVNSIFDPLGFAAPIVVEGKRILRDLVSSGAQWDDVLPQEHYDRWNRWKESLHYLQQVQIPRTYLPTSFSCLSNKTLHVFSDASENVISACAYVKSENYEHYGFVIGKAKVAPRHGHTIPRLELCAAVLGINVAFTIGRQLDIPMNCFVYHTDSKIVLGYICNTTKRFSVYVSNRVQKILKHSIPSQWNYVSTHVNPADYATRPTSPDRLQTSPWLLGPEPRSNISTVPDDEDVAFDNDPEVFIHKTDVRASGIGTQRFKKFSSWDKLIRAIRLLKDVAKRHKGTDSEDVIDSCHPLTEAEMYAIKQVQQEEYSHEYASLKRNLYLPNDSSILPLHPYLDSDGMLRVNGRLRNSPLSFNEKFPLIIPGKHHVAKLLVQHHHTKTQHQGRHLTEGTIRAAGLWITGGKRLIQSLIHRCVTCRKLRGKEEFQIMSDLPADRVTPTPPFTHVGIDTFGPWSIVTRRTRGGQANSKRWALMFTCLTTRAIHIEVIEEMTTSSFINGLRRFISIRGNVTTFRSDCGTNFVGATDILDIHKVNVEDAPVQSFLDSHRAQWIFNPPHSSHMGGVWERMIGVARRILDKVMSDVVPAKLSHEVLVTFMAEVCSIVNARPIVPVSSDPEDPFILSPSTLLTGKTNHVTEPMKGCTGTIQDLYKRQWKQVQQLADTFWSKWRTQFLQGLQKRTKWTKSKPNISKGDIVLLKDKTMKRNLWPMGRILNVTESDDGKVRKATVTVNINGKLTQYARPVTSLVLLLSN